jgi:CRISPR type IV-associated protein Csf2
MSLFHKIDGILTLTAPYHCTDESKSTTTMLKKQAIVTSDGRLVREIIGPANSNRGAIRREIGKLISTVIVKEGGKGLSVEVYNGLHSGSGAGRPENNTKISEMIAGRNHPLIGTMGGGIRMHPSTLRFSDMYPVTADSISAGLVPKEYEHLAPTVTYTDPVTKATVKRPATSHDLINAVNMIKVDDAGRVLRPAEISAMIENPLESVAEHQMLMTENQSTRKQEKAAIKATGVTADGTTEVTKKAGGDNMMTIQAVAPGTKMYFNVGFAPGLQGYHIGTVLIGLRGFVRRQALGGKISLGFGRFQADLALDMTNEAGERESIRIFDNGIGADVDFSTHPMIQDLVEQGRQAIAACTYADTVEFFTPRELPPEVTSLATEKAKKSAKKGAAIEEEYPSIAAE